MHNHYSIEKDIENYTDENWAVSVSVAASVLFSLLLRGRTHVTDAGETISWISQAAGMYGSDATATGGNPTDPEKGLVQCASILRRSEIRYEQRRNLLSEGSRTSAR